MKAVSPMFFQFFLIIAFFLVLHMQCAAADALGSSFLISFLAPFFSFFFSLQVQCDASDDLGRSALLLAVHHRQQEVVVLLLSMYPPPHMACILLHIWHVSSSSFGM